MSVDVENSTHCWV